MEERGRGGGRRERERERERERRGEERGTTTTLFHSLATETVHKSKLLREILPPHKDNAPFLSRHPHCLPSYTP